MPEPVRWIWFTGVIATSGATPTYGGLIFEPEMIESLVAALNAGQIPMRGHHDQTRRPRTRNVAATVECLEDGRLAARITGEMAEQDWAQLGDVRGLSVAAAFPLVPPEQYRVAGLAADLSWFSEDDIIDAARAAGSGVAPNGYVQFSAVVPAKIVIDLGIDFVASAIWGGVVAGTTFLLRRRRTPPGADPQAPTTIEVHVQEGDRRITTVVTTTSDRVAEEALQRLPQALPQYREEDLLVWRHEETEPNSTTQSGRWMPPQ